jgi:hypothetical protein
MRARVKLLAIVACHVGEAVVFSAAGMAGDIENAVLCAIFLLVVAAIAAAVHRMASRDLKKYAGYLEDEGNRWLDDDVLAGMKKGFADRIRDSKATSSACCASFVLIMIAGMIVAAIVKGISWTSIVMAGGLVFGVVLFAPELTAAVAAADGVDTITKAIKRMKRLRNKE